MHNLVLSVFVIMCLVLTSVLRLFYKWARGQGRSKTVVVVMCGNALVLVVILSSMTVAGELYYRFFYDTTDSFGVSMVTTRWFSRHFHVNESGFRDSVNYVPQIAKGKRRITFLGDSFTAGHGIQNVEDRFANQIRAARPEWEIHVTANCGWDTAAELDFMKHLTSSTYELDTVVLVYCLNDVADIIPEWQQILSRVYQSKPPGFFVKNSYLVNTLHSRFRSSQVPAVSNYYGFVRKGYEEPLWSVHKERLRQVRDVVAARGGALVVVTFPFLHALDGTYEWNEVHVRLGKLWDELGVAHLDLLDIYSSRMAEDVVVNTYDAHPNEMASELAGAAIREFLDKYLSTRNQQGND